ncbi:MAG: hypothetical protein F6K54_08660 [Okeania sp. SIO3B5]|uniref:hypothetical protein n=1 Tax=Okeania sp. SIO3B5 TaxID=2607811 RepID=UPI0014012F46|nr:hypothetical protein [Okeania sp. SIO3B5]NEO53148.1 hypothetical protein [Okeania sp. SIO3B5]
MARKQYNCPLAERLNWFETTRTPVNACPLNVSVVGTFAFLLSLAVTKMRTSVHQIYQNIPEFRIQTRDGRKKDSNGNPITRKGETCYDEKRYYGADC